MRRALPGKSPTVVLIWATAIFIRLELKYRVNDPSAILPETPRLLESLEDVAPSEWDALAGGNPTVSYAFLDSLHRSGSRSEEHTSELQSHVNLVCRLLLE